MTLCNTLCDERLRAAEVIMNASTKDRLKIVFIGGGSVNWAPTIVRDLLLTPSLSGAEFVLLDTNPKAAALTEAFLSKLARELGVNATFRATERVEDLAGAGYIIITISTGGLDAMAHDLAIPEKYGIFHTVGDTSGPGGWARLVRNFNVFEGLARDINRYAPGALVLNYTNPMTGLTDVLARLCEGPVVGLCHGLFENLDLIQKLYGLENESEISISYGGLNHFFWADKVRAGSTDVLPDLSKRLQDASFTDILRGLHEGDAMGFTSNREVATELFHLTGLMPYLGDRHTCEFFSPYITSRENLDKYKLVRTTIQERRDGLEKQRAKVEEMVKGDIGPQFHKRSRETAADIIDAHFGGRVFIDVGNVPNIGQIANLPAGLVVETAVRVDTGGFTPLAFGALPPVVHAMIEPYAHVFPLTVDACFARDRRLALQALRLDPVCAHLPMARLNEMSEELLNAHAAFNPLWSS